MIPGINHYYNMKQNTPLDSVVLSGWSHGHYFIRAAADRRVFTDGDLKV